LPRCSSKGKLPVTRWWEGHADDHSSPVVGAARTGAPVWPCKLLLPADAELRLSGDRF
jgi:hypothetical protein